MFVIMMPPASNYNELTKLGEKVTIMTEKEFSFELLQNILYLCIHPMPFHYHLARDLNISATNFVLNEIVSEIQTKKEKQNSFNNLSQSSSSSQDSTLEEIVETENATGESYVQFDW